MTGNGSSLCLLFHVYADRLEKEALCRQRAGGEPALPGCRVRNGPGGHGGWGAVLGKWGCWGGARSWSQVVGHIPNGRCLVLLLHWYITSAEQAVFICAPSRSTFMLLFNTSFKSNVYILLFFCSNTTGVVYVLRKIQEPGYACCCSSHWFTFMTYMTDL